jgi:putative ABC transport system permease protein
MARLREWWTDLIHDLWYGFRTLRRSPFFTGIAVGTLALGIGATTAVFSLVDMLVFRDLPVRDPTRLVQFAWTYPGDPPLNIFSVDDYERYRDNNTVFSEMLGTASGRVDAQTPQGGPQTLGINCVTGNFFSSLGVSSATGRLLGEADNRPGAPAAAVVSWKYWHGHLDRAPDVLGRSIVLLGDLPVTIVGVADRSFSGLAAGYTPDVWIPMGVCERKRRGGMALMARLKDGVSIDRAQAEMRVLDRPRIEAFTRRDPQWREVLLEVLPARAGLATPLHHQFARPLSVLLSILGALLLLACVNIAGLLLARGAARQQEIAVRVSLGAGRLRIVRQLFAESLLLGFAGGLLGIAGAWFGASVLLQIVVSGTRSPGAPASLDVTVDARVLLFTTTVALLATVILGLLPAVAAFPSAPAATLRESGGAGAPRSRRLFANGLVVAQVALAVTLLSTSALLIGHLSNLRNASLGFDRTSVLLVRLDASSDGQGRANLQQRSSELLGRFATIPGVRSVTLSATTPLSGGAASRFATVDGFQEEPEARRRLLLNLVAPVYFATFGTPLIAGRDFGPDEADSSRVAIVNQAMVRHYFADRDPLGTHVRFDGDPQPYRIVGVVADAKYADARAPAPRTIYLHYFQQSGSAPEFALRTSVPPTSIVGDIRRVAEEVAGPVRVTKVTTLAEQVDAAIVPERLIAAVSGFFGVVGLVLAAVGLFGLLAYTVARRTREIGLRMALGATRSDIARTVFGAAAALVSAGLLVGALVALWSVRVAATMVENLPERPVLPIAAAAAATIVLSLAAAYVPARRATRVDPVVALRAE